MKIELGIQRDTRSEGVPDDAAFQRWVKAALSGRRERAALALRIVDDEEGQRFNREYRARDYATNVLSFPADLPEGLPDEVRCFELGDLLMCAPVVAREAIDQHRSEADHWAHMVVHGVLHLLGHDHQQTDEARTMELLETQILAGLGIADPYLDLS